MGATDQDSSRAAARSASGIVIVIGRLGPADVAGLCEEVRRTLEWSDNDVVICDVGMVMDPDAGTVDALARVQLTARRLGRTIVLRGCPSRLQELLALAGLSDVLRGS